MLCFLRPRAEGSRPLAVAGDLVAALVSLGVGAFVVVQTEPVFSRWWLDGVSLGDRAGAETGWDLTIGFIGFWWLEVSSLLFVYMLFSFFLSGHMFPLDMLPEPWGRLVDLLPLKYLAYFPAAVFLGKVPEDELLGELCIEAGWIVLFAVTARAMYHRGLRRYSGYGG